MPEPSEFPGRDGARVLAPSRGTSVEVLEEKSPGRGRASVEALSSGTSYEAMQDTFNSLGESPASAEAALRDIYVGDYSLTKETSPQAPPQEDQRPHTVTSSSQTIQSSSTQQMQSQPYIVNGYRQLPRSEGPRIREQAMLSSRKLHRDAKRASKRQGHRQRQT